MSAIIRFMFINAESFNQPIGDLDLSNITDMDRIFRDAVAMQPSNAPNLEDAFEYEEATPLSQAID
jgi:hypothetical protein